MRGRILDYVQLFGGKRRLTVELDEPFDSYDRLKDGDIEITVKKHYDKRSMDANRYAWVLIDKIAEQMKLSKPEVYRWAIRNIGGVSETVCVMDKAVEKLCQGWSKNGLGWQTEQFPSKIEGCTNVILYYGSSTYDKRQMSALIDSLVMECQTLGIETRPAEEIESLIKESFK